MTTSITILIPAYNEEKHLKNTVLKYSKHLKEQIDKKTLKSGKILICVNGCKDRTEEIAKEMKSDLVSYISTDLKGFGVALNLGIENTDSEWVTYLPADGEIDSSYIGNCIKVINKENPDFIMGKRINEWRDPNRSILSKVLNKWVSFWLSKGLDLGTVRAFKTEWAKKYVLKMPHGFESQVTTIAEELKQNLKIAFADVKNISVRDAKESSVNPIKDGCKLGWTVFKCGMQIKWKKKK